jgi:hypothetical protein
MLSLAELAAFEQNVELQTKIKWSFLIMFNTTMIFEMVTEPLFGESDPKSSKSRGIQQYAGAYCRNFKAKGKAAAKV